MTYKEEAERLQAENAELKAHIERWASDKRLGWLDETNPPHATVYGEYGYQICYRCRSFWPCPTEVVKGWKE